jgi:hypothetical protein
VSIAGRKARRAAGLIGEMMKRAVKEALLAALICACLFDNGANKFP